ncbi:hypothetical protein KY321_03310 [Candidatus Woesearchaeota archaeon]|nr:hypothetical protein [Candidatus Woesearchaeota archaeon]
MRKLTLYVLIILLLTTFASASSIDAKIVPVKDAISANEEAAFQLQITNSGLSDDFKVYYNGIEWYMTPVNVKINPFETETININIKPLYVNLGQHAVPLKIKRSSSNEITDLDLIINIKDESNNEYLPTISVKADTTSELTPDKALDVKANIINRNPLNLENLKLLIESEYFSKEEDFSLSPTTAGNISEFEIVSKFRIPETTSPGRFNIFFTVLLNGTEIYKTSETSTVLEHIPDFEINKTDDDSLFKSKTKYNVKNSGNVGSTETHKVEISLFKQMFTSQVPEASLLKENGKRYLMWEVELESGEETEYMIVTNYRPFLLLILIITAVVVFYFLLRNPLVIKKTAKVIKYEEGGISMLKVMIIIKNISEKKITKLAIKDSIPHLAEYYREDHLGSLAPAKVIRHDKKGTSLVWEIEEFDGFEERIISYKLKTHLKVLGGITLNAVAGRFKSSKGNIREVKSAPLRLVFNKKDQ